MRPTASCNQLDDSPIRCIVTALIHALSCYFPLYVNAFRRSNDPSNEMLCIAPTYVNAVVLFLQKGGENLNK